MNNVHARGARIHCQYKLTQSLFHWMQLRLIITALSAEPILLEILNKIHLHPPRALPPPKITADKQKGEKKSTKLKPRPTGIWEKGMRCRWGSPHTSSVAKPNPEFEPGARPSAAASAPTPHGAGAGVKGKRRLHQLALSCHITHTRER